MNEPQRAVSDVDLSHGPAVSTPDPSRWKALAVIALAQFMLQLDATVVNVALPNLGTDLGLSRTAFTWTVSVYGLVFGGLLLLGGRLADIFGTRTIILTGLATFTVASLVSGLAQNETILLSGRVGQGVGAALLSPAALAAITGIFTGDERNKALGIWSSLGGLGFTVGVLIGGLLTAGPGWRWVFFINVPIGIVLFAAIRAIVRGRRHPDADTRLDVVGAITVTAATGSLIYGIVNAGNHGWGDPAVLIPIVAAAILYTVFIFTERAVRTPLMRLNLLTRRPIAAGAFIMFTGAGITVADLFLGSQYLQRLRGLSALQTGLFFLVPALGVVVGAILAGRLVGRIGTRPVALVAYALVAIGNGLLITVSDTGGIYTQALAGVTLFALGAGPLFVCATTTALATVDLRQAGIVSGIVNTFNPLGQAVTVAVVSTVAAISLSQAHNPDGFSHAFATLTIAAIGAAVIALVLIPAKPQLTAGGGNPQ